MLHPLSAPAFERLIRDSKYPPTAKVISYVDCARAISEYVITGRMKAVALEEHEQEVFDIFRASKPFVPKGMLARGVTPASETKKWLIEGVHVTFVPDLAIEGPKGRGVVKLHCNKDTLPRGVGPLMASLLFLHQRDVLKVPNVRPELCFVYEVRTGKIHKPGSNPDRAFERAKAACRIVASHWGSVRK